MLADCHEPRRVDTRAMGRSGPGLEVRDDDRDVAVLQAPEEVAQVAVLAFPDALRDEEVMACIVPRRGTGDAVLARVLFDHCFAELAYYPLSL